MDTIEAAVLLAASHHAALVPLLILRLSERKGVRLEHIQQPKGFLEAVQRKAFRSTSLLSASRCSQALECNVSSCW